MTTVRDPLDRVLGAKTAKPLHDAFGLQTAVTCCGHYPRRYVTRGELTELSSLREGEHVTVLAKVALAQRRPNGNRRGERLEVTVTDGTARLTLTYLHTGSGTGSSCCGRSGRACSRARCPPSAAAASSSTRSARCSRTATRPA